MLRIIKPIQKILGLTIISSAITWGSLVVAQGRSFFFPSASFFSPNAAILESEDVADVFTILEGMKQNQQFYSQLKSSKLSEKLRGQNLTVLAPTNEAFTKLPADVQAKLADPEKLEQLLKYHFVAGEITEEDIQRQAVATLLEQTSVSITGIPLGDQVGVKLNDATATQPITADGGIIIPIDRVLIPPGF